MNKKKLQKLRKSIANFKKLINDFPKAENLQKRLTRLLVEEADMCDSIGKQNKKP